MSCSGALLMACCCNCIDPSSTSSYTAAVTLRDIITNPCGSFPGQHQAALSVNNSFMFTGTGGFSINTVSSTGSTLTYENCDSSVTQSGMLVQITLSCNLTDKTKYDLGIVISVPGSPFMIPVYENFPNTFTGRIPSTGTFSITLPNSLSTVFVSGGFCDLTIIR